MKIEADLHVHTISSGHAYSTINELALTAAKKGLKMIAITDHGPSVPGGPSPVYFSNMKVLPDFIHGVKILKGVEANITNEGGLDLSEDQLEWLNFIVAGIHRNTGYKGKTRADHTNATINAIKNPWVRMISHPDNLRFPVDLRAVVQTAAEYKVILEVNASSFDQFRYGTRGSLEETVEMCSLAKKFHVPLSFNSDAHFHLDVGNIKTLTTVIERANLTKEDIINTSVEKLEQFMGEHPKMPVRSFSG